MKKLFTLFAVTFLATSLFAQSNVVKLNLPSLAFNRLSLEYERVLVPKVSATLGLNYMIPTAFEGTGVASDLDLFGANPPKMKGTALNLEVRLYTSATKETPRGFYLAPYFRMGSQKVDIDDFEYSFTTEVSTDDLGLSYGGFAASTTTTTTVSMGAEFGVSETGFGLQLGHQWLIGDRVSIDWFFFGPRIGFYNIVAKVDASAQVNGEEVINMNDIGDSLAEDLGLFDGVDASIETTATSAKVKIPFTLPGVRSGLKIGFAF